DCAPRAHRAPHDPAFTVRVRGGDRVRPVGTGRAGGGAAFTASRRRPRELAAGSPWTVTGRIEMTARKTKKKAAKKATKKTGTKKAVKKAGAKKAAGKKAAARKATTKKTATKKATTKKAATKKTAKAAAGRRKDKVVLLAGGNPQIPKGEGDAPVQAYIAAMPGW